jgi:hypothetical protein
MVYKMTQKGGDHFLKPCKNSAQHYVPQFIIRNFAFNKKQDQVWVFEKKSSKIFRSNIRNVASEKGFYDTISEGQNISVDPALTEVETLASPVIDKVVTQESLTCLSGDEKRVLCYFFAAQFARTKQMRIAQEGLCRQMDDWIRSMGGDPETVMGYDLLSADARKEAAVRNLAASILEYAPLFLPKTWILLKTTQAPFYISDNPIALQNSIDHRPFGSIGLAVKGIEIYLPLSKSLTLLMLCPAMAARQLQIYACYKRCEAMAPEVTRKAIPDPSSLEIFAEGVKSGKAVVIPDYYLTNLNSLQVACASKLVFSNTDDFGIAEQYVKSIPKQ